MKHFQKLKPKHVCFSCYQDIAQFNSFVQKIVSFREGKTKNILGKVPKGITVKKVQGGASKESEELKQSSVHDALKLESVFLKAEPADDYVVKFETMQELPLDITSILETDEREDFDDDFFLEDDKNAKDNPSMTRISELNFTCANCKNSYSDFETLTEHITSRVRKNCDKFNRLIRHQFVLDLHLRPFKMQVLSQTIQRQKTIARAPEKPPGEKQN